MPEVSVIVPAYNAAETLEAAVRSALAQTESDLEVVVVDDASTDLTFAVASALAGADERVRVLRNAENCGASVSRNLAIESSTGDWIALLDADDAWLPERVARMLAASDMADMVCDDLLMTRGVNDPQTDVPQWSFLSWISLTIKAPRQVTVVDFVRHDLGLLKPMIRRGFLDRHGIRYDPGLRVAHDFYFYFDLLSTGARWIQLPQAYYLYSARAGSLSSEPDVATGEHAARSRSLLAEPAVIADPALWTALRAHNRKARAVLAKIEVVELVERRDVAGLIRWARGRPRDALLVVRHSLRNLRLRLARRINNPRRPVPARVLGR
jgi:glycosyltransferase involved in cell wall biosynthesis